MTDASSHSSRPTTGEAATPAGSRGADSAGNAVFRKILAEIVSGVHAPGARLPAERELARTLGASRPTLREALRRLTEWCLVEPRRGSGIVVRPPSEWSIEVLPAYLRHGSRNKNLRLPIHQLLIDLLALRRSMLVDIVRLVCGRIGPGQLAPAREAVSRAWRLRAEPLQFLDADFAVMRKVVEVGGFYPALWLLNRIAGVYFDVASSLAHALEPPADYVEAHGRLFDALEASDREQAVAAMSDYLQRHDFALMGMVAPVNSSPSAADSKSAPASSQTDDSAPDGESRAGSGPESGPGSGSGSGSGSP